MGDLLLRSLNVSLRPGIRLLGVEKRPRPRPIPRPGHLGHLGHLGHRVSLSIWLDPGYTVPKIHCDRMDQVEPIGMIDMDIWIRKNFESSGEFSDHS